MAEAQFSLNRHLHSSPIVDFLVARRALHDHHDHQHRTEGNIGDSRSGSSTTTRSLMAPTTEYGGSRSLGSSYPVSRSPSLSQTSEARHALQYIVPRHHDIPISEDLGDAPLSALTHLVGVCYGIPFFLPPSSNTHPLLNKPCPRTEQCGGADTPSRPSTGEDAKESVVATARNKAMMMASTSTLSSRSAVTRSIASTASLVSPAHAYTRSLRTREELAIEVAAESKYIQEWGFFLKCYCEGQFNISRPPQPPPCKVAFTYLPALPPVDELDRLRAFKRLNAPCPDWALREARELVVSAMKLLEARHASISFFDRKNEIMRAECGYKRAVIPRGQSLAAHVLLSKTPMVLLDTQKDWRFQRHPLVVSSPFIRFYAASPIATPDGHVIGALAVFDPEPRFGFALNLRSTLEGLAQKAFDDFMKLSNCPQSMEEAHGRGGGERISSEKDAGPWSSFSEHAKTDSRNSPSQAAGNRMQGSRCDPTHLYNAYPSVSLPAIEKMQISTDKGASREQPPTPPYTPVKSDTPSRATMDEWNTLAKHNNPPSERIGFRDLDNGKELERPGTGRSTKESPKSTQDACQRVENDKGIDRQGNAVCEAPLEARYMMSLTAETLGWDFIYVIRIYPTFSSLASAQFPSGGCGGAESSGGGGGGGGGGEFDRRYIRLLVSHGLPNPAPVFSLALHLSALRSAGGLLYRDHHSGVRRDHTQERSGSQYEFQFGMMIPLARDPVRKALAGNRPTSVTSDCSCSCTTSVRSSTHTSGTDDPTATTSPTSHGASTDNDPQHRHAVEDQSPNDILRESPRCESGLVLGAFQRTAPRDDTPSCEEINSLREAGRHLRELLL